MSAPLRCVDCSTREIVQLPVDLHPRKYFALSYVWGPLKSGANNAGPKNAHSLPVKGVPAVIEDAIAVVLNLGEKYLWVDKYCIDQESHDIKKAQIREMDKGYAGAYATIIASAGPEASYGLPGVGARSRNNSYPPVVTTWGTPELHPPLPSREHAVEPSIYFVCPNTESIEAVLHKDKQTRIPTAGKTGNVGLGTPTSRNFDLAFARGLFWQPPSPDKKVVFREPWPGFPRWSWVASGGNVDYRQIFGFPNASYKCETKFLAESHPDSHGNVLYFDLMALAASALQDYNTRVIPELSLFLVLNAKVYQYLFQGLAPNLYGVCICHPSSPHRGTEKPQILGFPRFDTAERFPGYLKTRLGTRAIWDCVLLYESSCETAGRQERRHYLLVFDWVDKVAYRAGTLIFPVQDKTLKKLPWTRKRIRLG
ncbi:Heterokaryon incompatibility protein (HET) domain containing protein [Rhypophila sp. PSN 637]